MLRIPTRRQPVAPAGDVEQLGFEHFKSAIAAAMRAGKTHYNDLTGLVAPEVQEQLRAEFVGKTFQFNNMRRGCTIFWS